MTTPTARTLAELLRSLDPDDPDSTALLSWLDEATLHLRSQGGVTEQAQRAFSAARVRHMDSLKPGRGDDEGPAWSAAAVAGRALADALEPAT